MLLLFVGIYFHDSAADLGTGKPIQIVTPVHDEFELELDDLERILEAGYIKDRHVVVVSMDGPFRTGKSFLLNFFLRYLYAQVTIQTCFFL